MTPEIDRNSRREFVTDVGRFASAFALTSCMKPSAGTMLAPASGHPSASAEEWDLSWIDRLATATDRAVFDWPTLGDPADAFVLQLAERFLDNCVAAYGQRKYEARVVLNVRTQAVPAALGDVLWQRYALGVEYNVKDPVSKEPAVRNPFWYRAPSPVAGVTLPTMEDLLKRGSIALVCDFALGHLAKRLATKHNRSADDVHRDLRAGFIPGAYAVPSGIFGLARAQNSGCAYIRM